MPEEKSEQKPVGKIYIDGANMFYAQQKIGWFIDWQKIKKLFEKTYQIKGIRYYTGLKSGDVKSQKFNRRLKKYGLDVFTKPLKKIYLSNKKYIFKANFDVEIAVDLLLDVKTYDAAILFSGDSDFEYVVRQLQRLHKKVIIVSSRTALSRELAAVADKVILFGTIRKDIEFK